MGIGAGGRWGSFVTPTYNPQPTVLKIWLGGATYFPKPTPPREEVT